MTVVIYFILVIEYIFSLVYKFESIEFVCNIV